MLLLDTSQYPVKDRAEVLRAGLGDLTGAALEPVQGDALMKVRWRAWDLGDGCTLLNAQGSGFRIRRASSRIVPAESPVIGFSMMPSGSARFSQHDRREIVPAGGMFIAEMGEAFTCRLAGGSEGIDLQIPLEVLDVPLSDVQNAAQWLTRSPVYELACQHVLALLRYTKEFDAPHPSAQRSALYMLRALVRSFGTD
jgi:hypothetical protein